MDQQYGLALLALIVLACAFPLIFIDRYSRLRVRKRATRDLRRRVVALGKDEDTDQYPDLVAGLADAMLAVEIEPPSRWTRYLTRRSWRRAWDLLPRAQLKDDGGVWLLAMPACEERPAGVDHQAYVDARMVLKTIVERGLRGMIIEAKDESGSWVAVPARHVPYALQPIRSAVRDLIGSFGKWRE